MVINYIGGNVEIRPAGGVTEISGAGGALDGPGGVEFYFYAGIPTQEEQDNPALIPPEKLVLFAKSTHNGVTGDVPGELKLFFDDWTGNRIIQYRDGWMNPGNVQSIDPTRGDVVATLGPPYVRDPDGTTHMGRTIGNRYLLFECPTTTAKQKFMEFVANLRNAVQLNVLLPLAPNYVNQPWRPELPGGGSIYMLTAYTEPGGWDNSLLSSAGYMTDVADNTLNLPLPSKEYSPTAPVAKKFGEVTGNTSSDNPEYSPEVTWGWNKGRPWAYGRSETVWWLLYDDSGNEWKHKDHTDYIITTATGYGMAARIENHPKLLPNIDTGGYGGIERLTPWAAYMRTAGHSLTVKAWLDITGSGDLMYNGAAVDGFTSWGYDAVLNRLNDYAADSGRVNVDVYEGSDLVATGYIDVRKEWLEIMKAAGMDYT